MRRASRVVAPAVLLAGCTILTPTVDQVPPDAAAPDGQTLVLRVANRADRELAVTWEFSAPAIEGEGIGGPVPACETGAIALGTVAGAYRVFVDGEEVHAGQAPARDHGYLVLGVDVTPDGRATLRVPQRWTAIAPVFRTVPMAECG
jgi:hypothetical protein